MAPPRASRADPCSSLDCDPQGFRAVPWMRHGRGYCLLGLHGLCLAWATSASCSGEPAAERSNDPASQRDGGSHKARDTRDEDREPIPIALPTPPGAWPWEPRSLDTDEDGGASEQDEDGGMDVARLVDCGGGTCDLGGGSDCPAGRTCKFIHAPGERVPQAMCVPTADAEEGDTCTTYASCGSGLDCTVEGSEGTCREYCCEINQTATCPAGQFCKIALRASQGAATDTRLCDDCDACQLHDADTCQAGHACYLISAAGGCRACLPPGGVTPAAPCRWANDCGTEAGCFAVDGGSPKCMRYCQLDTDGQCDATTRCRRVTGVALGDAVGICQ